MSDSPRPGFYWARRIDSGDTMIVEIAEDISRKSLGLPQSLRVWCIGYEEPAPLDLYDQYVGPLDRPGVVQTAATTDDRRLVHNDAEIEFLEAWIKICKKYQLTTAEQLDIVANKIKSIATWAIRTDRQNSPASE